jgi:arginyl-tRNA synthetase
MRNQLLSAVNSAVEELFSVKLQAGLLITAENFGDYSTNAALQLAKQLQQSPQLIAERLQPVLEKKLGYSVKKIDVAGGGFLNFSLSDQTLLEMAEQAANYSPKKYQSQVIVIETNNPNPFKDFHIGHAYNSVVADTLANLLEKAGGQVHRVSYHGDVGLHVGKSMWAIEKTINGDVNALHAIPPEERPKFLSQKYAEGAQAYESDEAARQAIETLASQSFELTDDFYRQVYEICKDWSFQYFDQTVSSIGSRPVERKYLEREVDPAGRGIVEANLGRVFEKSDNAIIFPGENYGLHTRVFINSRGNTLYEARDLGLIQLKARDFSPQSSYIVTAAEQKDYFEVVFKAADLCLPDQSGKTHNIATGMVKLPSGKMSSRRGDAVNIDWLFQELTNALTKRGANDNSLHDGLIGALRYTMLKTRIGSDLVFDINESISLNGNSGPYLQYAHARACSVLAKAAASSSESDGSPELEAGERSLARKISQLPDSLDNASIDLMPHIICNYLYELAQEFNKFYETSQIVGDKRQTIRLQLVRIYAEALKNGLSILGIPAPERF